MSGFHKFLESRCIFSMYLTKYDLHVHPYLVIVMLYIPIITLETSIILVLLCRQFDRGQFQNPSLITKAHLIATAAMTLSV